MIRSLPLVESTDAKVDIEPAQAAMLADLGQRLASQREWWGDKDDDDDVQEEPAQRSPRTVVSVRPTSDGQWVIRVRDAVGLIALPRLQLVIRPKIPTAHFMYLLSRAEGLPRHETGQGALAVEPSLWALIAEWLVVATERLLRSDLAKGYFERTEALRSPIGRIDPLGTARLFYGGSLSFVSVYDEFDVDTPPNRVIRAAAETVAGSAVLDPVLRRRARRLVARLDGIGPLQPGDIRVEVDRQHARYAAPLALAKHVLRHRGRTFLGGADHAWTFLFRTPDVIEAGIRNSLDAALPMRVRKRRKPVAPGVTFNPDLVFGEGAAVGDVKYKLSNGSWNRSDLYQVISFAVAFKADRGLVVRFRTTDAPPAQPLTVGSISMRELTWLADENRPVKDAVSSFEADALGLQPWLAGLHQAEAQGAAPTGTEAPVADGVAVTTHPARGAGA